MFRPNVAIIRFSSESMVVVLYRIGMGMSRWWDLSICDVCYVLFLRGTGEGVSVMCAILGCAAQVCLLAAVLCGSPVTVCPYPMSTAAAAGQTVAGDPHRTAASWHTWAAHPRITQTTDPPPVPLKNSITDAEIWPSWHTHTNPIKHHHHTFGWKPDDGHITPKQVVYFILY